MLRSKFVKFHKSILKRQVNSSSNVSLLFSVITHNSSVAHGFSTLDERISSKFHQSSNFSTFECSGENLPNSSCHFPKQFSKVSFLHILTSLFSVVKDNSSILVQVKRYIRCTKGTNQSANFWDFWGLGSKFTKFLSFFKHKPIFL